MRGGRPPSAAAPPLPTPPPCAFLFQLVGARARSLPPHFLSSTRRCALSPNELAMRPRSCCSDHSVQVATRRSDSTAPMALGLAPSSSRPPGLRRRRCPRPRCRTSRRGGATRAGTPGSDAPPRPSRYRPRRRHRRGRLARPTAAAPRRVVAAPRPPRRVMSTTTARRRRRFHGSGCGPSARPRRARRGRRF